MLTSPAKEEQETSPTFLGDHSTWKVQLEAGGSSVRYSALSGSQTIVRLSLPDEISRLVSKGHQLAERMPLWCPRSSSSGAKALRRSHTWRTGLRSSSEATRTRVVASGDHSITELRCVRLFGSWKLITGRFCFRSHTTLSPPCDVEARMCGTLRFHATHEMSAGGEEVLAPGE